MIEMELHPVVAWSVGLAMLALFVVAVVECIRHMHCRERRRVVDRAVESALLGSEVAVTFPHNIQCPECGGLLAVNRHARAKCTQRGCILIDREFRVPCESIVLRPIDEADCDQEGSGA